MIAGAHPLSKTDHGETGREERRGTKESGGMVDVEVWLPDVMAIATCLTMVVAVWACGTWYWPGMLGFTARVPATCTLLKLRALATSDTSALAIDPPVCVR